MKDNSKKLKKRFKKFNKYFNEATEFLGIVNNRFTIEIIDYDEDYQATTEWRHRYDHDDGSRHFLVRVNKEFLINGNKGLLREVAWHEAMEVMLSKLNDMASSDKRMVSDVEIEEEIHKVVHMVTNRVMPLVKKK